MGAFDSFSAFTRSGAYWSSSGAMNVIAVPLLPARPALEEKRDAADLMREYRRSAGCKLTAAHDAYLMASRCEHGWQLWKSYLFHTILAS